MWGKPERMALRETGNDRPTPHDDTDELHDDGAVRSGTQGVETPERRTIRILIADDHKLMRDALVDVCNRQERFRVVGQASDGGQAVELARAHRPDVVLMDVSMPQMDGIEATATILLENPGIAVIGLSMDGDPTNRERMMHRGAVDYLVKTVSMEAIVKAVRKAGRPDT
jgi:DNA-binding NarL/FixJ family response regulator